ncbi:replication factor C small subunit [Halorarius halobius]|uniref:replication factor C small subunit n=1 Tax=Halorarius halobius TaxID=2962671 RepID=UPI003313CA16
MSEAAEDADTERGREVWIEKYRPQTLDEVAGHENITERLKSYIERDDLPHLLFAGPAGVGKCVTGETPVLTNRGVEPIGDVVGETEGFDTPDDGLEVLTFADDGSFEYVEPSHVFGKRAENLVRVTTRDGNDLTVTPEHKLLTVGHDGLSWEPAGELDAGRRVVRPRSAPLPEGDDSLNWVDAMDGDRTFVHVTDEFARSHGIPAEENYVGKKKRVVAGLRRGEDEETIAAAADTPVETVRDYRRTLDCRVDEPSTVCSLSYLRELDVAREELETHVTAIQYVNRNNRRSEPIPPVWELTPELAAFVGLSVSEARLDGGRVKFYNTDDELLDRFEHVTEALFGLDVRQGEQNGVSYRAVASRSLTQFLEATVDVFDGATGGNGIGSALVRADAESRRAFLRAVFDAEGHVTENGIVELTQKNERLITLVSYLLSGFGVPSRRKRQQKAATNGTGTEREYHTLYVSSARHLEQFREHVGFTLDEKAERLATNATRDPNPNDDTVPTQAAVDTLCEELYLTKSDYVPDSLNPESPGRESYLDRVDELVDAATARIDDAQAVLERLDRLRADIDAATAVPATWAGERGKLEPIDTRRELEAETGVRSDRLLEYADGRRTPGTERALELLESIDGTATDTDLGRVRRTLTDCIETLGVPYNHVADETEMRGTEVINLLDGGNDLASLTRFRTVADRVRSVAAGMLSETVLDALSELDTLVGSDLYFDEVESVERVDEPERVYDLTVPGTRNYVAGRVPTVMHNTTCAVAIARELYGDDWRENFLELNASDQRGIDVVRDRIKNFARSSFGGHDYRIIFLDEADALTSDAQSALRRTMEQFSNNTRFILSCNYSSQIIDPIQSRCAVFRFSPLADEAVEEQVREIAATEGIDVTDDGVDALVYAADGDMRKAINGLQAAAVMGDTVDEEAVYAITSTARPEEIKEMVELALDGDFTQSRSKLDTLLTEVGIAGGDVIDQLHRSVWEFDLSEREAVRLMDRIGEADYRITAGANEQVQLEALLASLALDEE